MDLAPKVVSRRTDYSALAQGVYSNVPDWLDVAMGPVENVFRWQHTSNGRCLPNMLSEQSSP